MFRYFCSHFIWKVMAMVIVYGEHEIPQKRNSIVWLKIVVPHSLFPDGWFHVAEKKSHYVAWQVCHKTGALFLRRRLQQQTPWWSLVASRHHCTDERAAAIQLVPKLSINSFLTTDNCDTIKMSPLTSVGLLAQKKSYICFAASI